MIQELFRVGSFAVTPFGLMLVLALLAAYWQLERGMRHYGIGDAEDASAIVFACGFVGILGGKVYYAVLVRDVTMIWDRAGIVWYGCFFGGFLAFLWVIRRYDLPMARTFDAAGPALALGYSIGRVGCLLVGDDYGVPTDLPWGMKFPVGLPPTTAGALRRQFGVDVPASVPDSQLLAVHPTQIYSSLAALAIFGVAWWLMRRRDLRPGNLFLLVVSLLSVERFLVEFVRAKDDRFFGDLTLAQVISVVILLAVVGVALYRRGDAASSGAAKAS